jgi:hypothetical protein
LAHTSHCRGPPWLARHDGPYSASGRGLRIRACVCGRIGACVRASVRA